MAYWDLIRLSFHVEHFFTLVPPCSFATSFCTLDQGALHWVRKGPPTLGLRVRRDSGHIRIEIFPFVVERCDEESCDVRSRR